MKSILGKIWALPTTLAGMIFGLLGVCFAPRKIRICIAHNAICFYNHPFIRGNVIGLTIGNAIFFQGDTDYFHGTDVGAHEEQHTIQGEVLGPFYLPLHGYYLVKYFRTPWLNPLEIGPHAVPARPWK